jgi:Phospholipase_D-nuclease N-terminal
MSSTALPILKQLLPLLIPVLIIQIVLLVFALVDLSKQKATRGPKWVWAVVIIFINILGPILYFVLGRKEE